MRALSHFEREVEAWTAALTPHPCRPQVRWEGRESPCLLAARRLGDGRQGERVMEGRHISCSLLCRALPRGF
jgi:hypothetical protein